MPRTALDEVLLRLDTAAGDARQPRPRLLAVAKTQAATAVANLARAGQRVFGENYVQEAAAHQLALRTEADLPALEWHLIGHLQSNKAKDAAELFDWVQTVDRPRIADALARHPNTSRSPLNVALQVNIDDEASKQGCAPEQLDALVESVLAQPALQLRGLMAIPAPHADPELRRPAFRRMRVLFDALRARQPQVDTLSMGMSDDFAIAIAEGATMVRIGTALFGARAPKP